MRRTLFMGIIIATLVFLITPKISQATTIITVNSTADTTTNDGVCTLREAIISSNNDAASGLAAGECAAGSGDDIIEFNIAEPADFTNDGQNGYTIKPQEATPQITETVTINGYSQPGASENTTTAPNPFDAVILIELDGSESGPGFSAGFNVGLSAEDVVITGFAINRFFGQGVGGAGGGPRVAVKGNYIGTDPTGLIDEGNANIGIQGGEGWIVGGLNPEDRNIIAGNDSNAIATDEDDWMIQGNYISVDATGLVALSNSQDVSPALTFDQSDGHTIGGSNAGATNVISGHNEYAVSITDSNDTAVEGNYIGVGYDGISPLPNGGDGVYANTSDNLHINDNVISANDAHGINIANSNNTEITGNKIGVDKNGANDLGNEFSGISLDESTGIIGGVLPADENIVANQIDGPGVAIKGDGKKVSILNNSIFDNRYLGIDLGYNDLTENDPLDADTGPNDLLNHPHWTDMTTGGGGTTATYNLDVPAGDYRIEFYYNDTFDANGHGEGQVFIDSQDITSNGSGEQEFTKFLPPAGLTDIAMTATEIDESSSTGFGATSEFGGEAPPVTDVMVKNELLNTSEVTQGSTVDYKYAFKNLGHSDLELDDFDGSGMNPFATNLFIAVVPFELNFVAVSSTNADIECSLYPVDTNNPAVVGFLPNHPDHDIVTCTYTGASATLSEDEEIDTTLSFVVDGSSDLEFETNLVSGWPEFDPDLPTMNNGFSFDAQCVGYTDMLDCYEGEQINNFATSVFPDHDNDGIPSTVENAGPNNGDANNDGTLDSLQANVASYINAITNKRVVLEVSDTCSIESTGVSAESANTVQDGSYIYPLGLLAFTLDCGEAGSTADVNQYFFDAAAESYTLRKYDTNTNTYFNIDNATISQETIGSQVAIKASYQITDGGALDMDQAADGSITDPAGLALQPNLLEALPTTTGRIISQLASTGQAARIVMFVALAMIVAGLSAVFYVRQRFKAV